MTKYHVIGIDPSLSGTGIAYDNGQLALVKTYAKEGDPRLQTIYDKVYEAAGSGYWKHTPSLAVIEDLPVNAMSAGKTGQSQGVTRLALCAAGVSILSIPPSVLKKFATGNGAAKKPDMIAAWNEFKRGAKETDDNRVDAAWLREIGRQLMEAADKPETWMAPRNSRLGFVADHLHLARQIRAGYVIQ